MDVSWPEDLASRGGSQPFHNSVTVHDRLQLFGFDFPVLGTDVTYTRPGKYKTVFYNTKSIQLSPEGEMGCREEEDGGGEEETSRPMMCLRKTIQVILVICKGFGSFSQT